MAKSSPRKKPLSKTQLIATISAAANVPKKKVAEVLSVLVDEIEKCLTARQPRRVAIPGVMEFWVEKEAARPARKRVPNPFNPREIIDIPARPATTKIKAKALRLIRSSDPGESGSGGG